MRRPILLAVNLAAVIVFALFMPLEKTLGANIRLVYLHGAWVWCGLAAFGLSALLALPALLTRKPDLFGWCAALGRSGLLFWLTYLPMSLLVMQMNWGGFYFDEPRWRIPLAFAIVGLLLQLGLWLMQTPTLTAAGNLVFGAALWWSTLNMRSILHPESPVWQSGSLRIQLFFAGLLLLVLLLGYQVTAWLKLVDRRIV